MVCDYAKRTFSRQFHVRTYKIKIYLLCLLIINGVNSRQSFEAKLNVSNLHKYAQLPEWSEIEKAITEGTQIKERSVKNNSTFNDARHRLK